MDPIHGGIPLLHHEVKMVDHPLFQRLRFICQNDILSLVFPGATHSRFLHSIGVMHVGGRIFNAMIENSIKLKHAELEKGKASSISTSTLEAINYFNQVIRSACLLHDVGHCSFSHQFNRTPTIKKALAEPNRFDALWSGIDYAKIYPTKPEKLEHEHFSVRAAWQILADITAQDIPVAAEDILSLMDTTSVHPSNLFQQHAASLWLLIKPKDIEENRPPENFAVKLQGVFSRIVSGELDADRADYMLRDGFHSSVTIGGFNLDHLLSSLHFGWCAQTSWFGLAISDKGISSLEDFVYSRHQMYRQVYAHKTAQGFDWLLRAAIDEVMTQKPVYLFVDTCLSEINKFKNLTDSYFWEAFRQYATTHPRSYSHCILDRIKMKHIATRKNLSKEEQQHYLEFLAKEHKCDINNLVSSGITARFTKIGADFDDIKVLSFDHQLGISTLKSISTSSQFFDKFNDERITHFYINPVGDNGTLSP